jgi:MYXO-CTERM domain-containing protein
MAAAVATTDAQAGPCAPYIPEDFDLGLIDVTRDGTPAEEPVELGRIYKLTYASMGLLLSKGRDAESWDRRNFTLDSEIAPTPGAQAEIDEGDDRRTRGLGLQCSGTPYRTIRPGVYLQDQDDDYSTNSWNIGEPMLTVREDRRRVILEFDYDGSDWTAVYDVDRAYFRGDGCGCTSGPPSAPMAVLVLLGLCGLRRRRA